MHLFHELLHDLHELSDSLERLRLHRSMILLWVGFKKRRRRRKSNSRLRINEKGTKLRQNFGGNFVRVIV